ncbi:DUF480 domain-containing protein [Nocardioides sp. TRM66260-LWL]|uniref:DUF480 domain-containing protein n=1 Tax=Nocardioides sp. TRM66260-LWL TaxID=2874478 RepID=UPI001CC33A78|nr:DUF480 domain-containing protein [Nocardioides sp. TRM66260-LWL]MBZ5736278.1 DUF480 domain-containing protein [Nocardioides sp. TRM66260-LWL]
MIVLDPVEQRVLGALLEKQVTVPATYPLTLTALRTACNQTSSREPVMDLDERTIEEVAKALKARGLLRIVWSDTGRRTLKHHQTLDEALGLAGEQHAAARAVLTVLLLRGPQSPGELRTRTERLHPFADRDDVQRTLVALAARPEPLVERLERRPREQDHRWRHLLGDAEPVAPASASSASHVSSASTGSAGGGTEALLGVGAGTRDATVVATYDAIAAPYAERLVPELARMPFEQWLLGRVAAHAVALGAPLIEVGSGPGHVTAHLAGLGAPAQGLDVSPAMVAEARRRFPDLRFGEGDLRRLLRPERAEGWAAVVAWYSLIHLAASELPEAVAALARPLLPDGWLVLALHAGPAGGAVKHQPVWFEQRVDVDIALHDEHAVARVLADAGLVDVEWYRRGPIVARDEATERLYLLARRPA